MMTPRGIRGIATRSIAAVMEAIQLCAALLVSEHPDCHVLVYIATGWLHWRVIQRRPAHPS